MRSVNSRYSPAIDHLRALAALMILFYHGYGVILHRFAPGGVYPDPVTTNPFYVLIIEGHTAVGLFMVLSGFIFTRSAMGHAIDYSAFMVNRFLRIYPLMLAILTLAIALHPELFNPLKFVRSLLLFLDLPGIDFGPMLQIAPWTAIFWTITPEFDFYLIFPVLMFLGGRFGARPLIVLLLLAFAIRLTVAVFLFDVSDISYGTIVGRIDQFLIGMLTAMWTRGRFTTSRAAAWLFPISCGIVLAMLLALHRLGGLTAHAWWRAAWPTMEGGGWAFFIVTYLAIARHVPRRASTALLTIGEASYSIYLLHLAVISLLQWQAGTLFLRSPLSTWGLSPPCASLVVVALFLAPIALGISMVTYRLIEQPFLIMRVRYLRDRVLVPSPEKCLIGS